MVNQTENMSSAFEQNISIFDNSATNAAPLDYFIDRGIERGTHETKQKEKLVNLIQEVPKPIIGMDQSKTICRHSNHK